MKSQSQFYAGVTQTKRTIVRDSGKSILFMVSKNVISLARVRVFSLLCESARQLSLVQVI